MAADTAPALDLTAAERALATMAARRDAATCPLTGDEWLLLAEVERLQDVIAEQVADKCELRGEIDELKAKLATAERQTAELATSLTERLAALQDGNEGAYRELYDAMKGPHFCPDRPFGQTAAGEQVRR